MKRDLYAVHGLHFGFLLKHTCTGLPCEESNNKKWQFCTTCWGLGRLGGHGVGNEPLQWIPPVDPP